MNKKTALKMGFEPNKRIAKDYHNIRVHATIGGKTYWFRSKEEVKLAHYLELLKSVGYIKDWEYESHKFKFADSSWLVDFTVRNNDDSFEYYEYKGYVEPSTKKKLALLNKYWPEAKVTMVFGSKKDMEKLGSRATSYCHRVCLLRDLAQKVI